ncbi:hypothetical protein [Neobacillus drentensis]
MISTLRSPKTLDLEDIHQIYQSAFRGDINDKVGDVLCIGR